MGRGEGSGRGVLGKFLRKGDRISQGKCQRMKRKCLGEMPGEIPGKCQGKCGASARGKCQRNAWGNAREMPGEMPGRFRGNVGEVSGKMLEEIQGKFGGKCWKGSMLASKEG